MQRSSKWADWSLLDPSKNLLEENSDNQLYGREQGHIELEVKSLTEGKNVPKVVCDSNWVSDMNALSWIGST